METLSFLYLEAPVIAMVLLIALVVGHVEEWSWDERYVLQDRTVETATRSSKLLFLLVVLSGNSNRDALPLTSAVTHDPAKLALFPLLVSTTRL
jgi:hypothetical protein